MLFAIMCVGAREANEVVDLLADRDSPLMYFVFLICFVAWYSALVLPFCTYSLLIKFTC